VYNRELSLVRVIAVTPDLCRDEVYYFGILHGHETVHSAVLRSE